MLFGLHALIKDAQTGVCLPQSLIFISSSLNQRSNVSLGDWRSTSELRSQLLPSWLYHKNYTSINKILENTPPVWNLTIQQEMKNLILISFSDSTMLLRFTKQGSDWSVGNHHFWASVEKESTNMHLKAPERNWNSLCSSVDWTIPSREIAAGSDLCFCACWKVTSREITSFACPLRYQHVCVVAVKIIAVNLIVTYKKNTGNIYGLHVRFWQM